MRLYNGDCIEVMGQFEDRSIDMILTDLPYGTTKNSWDKKIPMEKLWGQFDRIIKDHGAIVMFAQTPFDKLLGASKIENQANGQDIRGRSEKLKLTIPHTTLCGDTAYFYS